MLIETSWPRKREEERVSERGSEAQLAIIPWNSIKIAKRAGAAQNQHRWSQTKSESESAWSAAKTRTNKPAKRSLVSSFPSGHSLSFTLALSLSCFLWLPLGLSLFISLQLSTAFLCLRSNRQWNSLSSFSIGSRTIWATNLWRTPKLARRWPRHWHPFLERDPLMSKFLMCHTAQVSPGPDLPDLPLCRAVPCSSNILDPLTLLSAANCSPESLTVRCPLVRSSALAPSRSRSLGSAVNPCGGV